MEAKKGSMTPISQDEAQLIKFILDGRKELFRQLVVRYADRVFRMVVRLIPSHEDAEEIVQDILLAAFQNLSRYDAQQASFNTWLSAITYRTTMKHIRRQQTVCFVETDRAWLESIPDNETDLLLNDTSHERLLQLDHAVEQLKTDDQMLLSLYYYDDYSIRDISYITGRDEGYLRSRLQWIRKRMALTIKTFEKQ